MIKSFLLAIQFLTVIPLKIRDTDEKKIRESMVFFPLAGLLLGLMLASINFFLSWLSFPQFSLNIILVVSLIVLTGGLHLDGLSDTADAILSRKEKVKMLEIMRDPHMGVMGALSIFSILLLKIAFLHSIGPSLKSTALLFMPTLSRWALVYSMYIFPYARQEGKAKTFIQGIDPKIFFYSTLAAVSIVLIILPFKGLLLMLLTAASAYLLNKFISSKLGGITGDTLGATSEIIEVITLAGCYLL